MQRAYIITTRYIDGLFFLFCLNERSDPMTLCVIEHHSYLYVKSNKSRSAKRREFEGEKLDIKLKLETASIRQPRSIETVEFHDAHHYSAHPTVHYKIHTECYKDLDRVGKTLRDFSVAAYPHEENKLFADLKLKPCQWIEFNTDETEPLQIREYETFRPIKELAIRSSSIRSINWGNVGANPNDTIHMSPRGSVNVPQPLEGRPGQVHYTQLPVELPPPRVLEAIFDCETYSARYGINRSLQMPDPIVADDLLYCVSLLLSWSDESSAFKTFCICVHDSDLRTSNSTEEIISVPNEEALFTKFFDLLRYYDPDVIYGHNSNGYDFAYIQKRTAMMFDLKSFGRLMSYEDRVVISGRTYEIKLDLPDCEVYQTKGYEGAGGLWYEHTIPNCYGRVILDTLTMLKKLKASPGSPDELQSHSLKDLGKFLVGESKQDLSYAETFYSYRSGDSGRIAEICSYCIQDSRLCMKIYHKTKCWIAVRESAAIFLQDANQVTITGQTAKSYTTFLRVAEREGFAFHPNANKREFKLKGGHVEKPVRGKHTNVLTFDFASMYPTAQQAFNICPSTASQLPPEGCEPSEYTKFEIPVEVGVIEMPARYEEYTGPNDEEFDPELIDDPMYIDEVMKWNNFAPEYRGSFLEMVRRDYNLPSKETMQTLIVHFVKASKRRGIFPMIQASLTEERSAYKKLMKEAEKRGDMIDKEMYDQRQQLVKVVMNSIYGCLGAAQGRISFPECAAAITYVGRTSILKVRSMLVERSCKIIYGDTDSLMFQLPGYNDENPLLSCPIAEDLISRGNELTNVINATLEKPMMMEFEKVINAIFIDKKRYVGRIIWPKQVTFTRGAAAVRGDTTPFTRVLYTSILGMLLEDRSREEVESYLEGQLGQLLSGRIGNEMLSVSKMLAHSYASPSAPMNVYARYLVSIGELAEAGTKLPLVVTKQVKSGPRSLSYRLPTTNEPVDYEYYAEMARRPLEKLLEAAFIHSGPLESE